MRVVPPLGRQRPAGKRVAGRFAGRVHRAAAERLQERSAPQRRPAQGKLQHDGHAREGDDRRGDASGGRPTFPPSRGGRTCDVVETDLVPKTRIQGELFIPTAKELTEPIGERIIEVPTDVEANQTLRNSRGTWIAYVPKGAVEKGKDLVTTGGMKIVNGQIVQGKTTACGTCHGIDLLGVPPDVPPLAGRSPSYLAREIFDIQQGARSGSNSNVPLMKMVVANLRAGRYRQHHGVPRVASGFEVARQPGRRQR